MRDKDRTRTRIEVRLFILAWKSNEFQMLSVSPEPSVNRLSFLNDIPGNVEVLTRRMDLGRKGVGGTRFGFQVTRMIEGVLWV